MWLKLMGCILIFLSTTGYGYFKGLEYKKHIEEIAYLKQVIWQLRGEMKYTKMPLEEICMRVSTQVKAPYDSWLKNLSKKLRVKGSGKLGNLWEEETIISLNDVHLKEIEKKELAFLGHQLGHLDISMQEQVLYWYEERLEEKRKKLSEKVDEKRRLCNCLGVMGGIFLIIVLF